MPDLLEEAKRLSEDATPGPWKHFRGTGQSDVFGEGDLPIGERPHVSTHYGPHHQADAVFAARARTLIPELVERLEQAERVVEAARQYIDCLDSEPRFETADLNPYSPRGRRELLREALAVQQRESK